MTSNKRSKCHGGPILPVTDNCCTAETGCEWDGTLRDVVTEPIYVQKVYDAALFNLQALSTVNNVHFSPDLPRGSRIKNVLDIRCKKYFNPSNIKDTRNFKIDPETILSGGEFVRDERGKDVEVVGPDGVSSQKLIYADTAECDMRDKGTPVFGTQKIRIRGNVVLEIDLQIINHRGRRTTHTVSANVPIAPVQSPLILTNFFELCIPSVQDSAYLPRFAEFCNVACEARLATNNVGRDIQIDGEKHCLTVDLIIALCATCEKKIVLPTQLCVLSTGFPELSPSVSPICTTFPTLFPKQIDRDQESDSETGGCHERPHRHYESESFNFSFHEEEE